SSNDVIPTAIHVSAALLLREELLPALARLAAAIGEREAQLKGIVKTGPTHPMDAKPMTLSQERSGRPRQAEKGIERLRAVEPRLLGLAQGGTAVGTGINADPRFGAACCQELARLTGIGFQPNENYFEALSAQDAAVELSGQLKVVAVSLMKI